MNRYLSACSPLRHSGNKHVLLREKENRRTRERKSGYILQRGARIVPSSGEGGNTETTPGKHVQNRGRAEFYAPPLKANGNKQQWGLSWWPVTGLISFCQSRVDSRGLQHHDKQTGTQIAGLVSITPRSSSFDSPTDLLLCPRHFHFSPPLGNSYDLRKIV